MVAIGSTNSQLSVLSYPGLEDVFPSIEYEGEELFDTDFNDDGDMASIVSRACHPWQQLRLTQQSLAGARRVVEQIVRVVDRA